MVLLNSIETKFDLEGRTLEFSKAIKSFVKALPKTVCNFEFVKQLVRSSSSIGANYIEANESLGSKDFVMHIRISCKEARETNYWLQLVDCDDELVRTGLINECRELIKIFGAMLRNSRK